MKELDSMPKDDRAWIYYERIEERFFHIRNEVNLEHTKEICRSHDRGICEHIDSPVGGTIYSWFSELESGRIHLAVGYPCRNEYRTYSIDTVHSKWSKQLHFTRLIL
jgi:hypothetical protein